jgi:16S rRNA (cytosine1402-N4)-methyltransferase
MSNLQNLRELHKPVLVNEVLMALGFDNEVLALSNKRLKIIDATIGLGGHSEEFIKRNAEVLGIDTDNRMLEIAQIRLNLACPTSDSHRKLYKLVKGNFKDIAEIAKKNNFLGINGILFDLGVSSPQITSKSRGFSFSDDSAELDMRMDENENGVKGSDLLNILRRDQLVSMFEKVLDYKSSRRLADQVIIFRQLKLFEKVGDYKNVINKVIYHKGSANIATQPFLALRMAVNSELENIREGLTGALSVLNTKGRIVVIGFHSTEDIAVLNLLNKFESGGLGKLVTKKPITPKEIEISNNPRSRSALMRVFQKK